MRKARTKLEKERINKKVIGEMLEVLEKTGQESEVSSVPYVREVQKEQDVKENQETADALNKLDMHKRSTRAYQENLKMEFIRSMLSYDLPTGWKWTVRLDRKGIAVYIHSVRGKTYGHGMIPCGTPVFDINCMDRMLIKALNFMEQKDTEAKTRTESGIYLK